jgi:RND superfamily putative drug exporter
VLLDAVLVRLVLVPILLRLAGRAARWLPRWLHRPVLDVRFGH